MRTGMFILREVLREFFFVTLATYLMTALLEMLAPGFLTNVVPKNALLIPVGVAGLATFVLPPFPHPRATRRAVTQKLKEFLCYVLCAFLAGSFVWLRLRPQPVIAEMITGMVVLTLLSLGVIVWHDQNTE